MKGLTVEQMALLVAKGFSAEEMLAFAQMGQTKTKGAARTARWRAKKAGNVTDSVTSDATRDGHSDVSPPPNDIYSNPPVSSDDETPPARRVKSGLSKPEGVKDQTWQDFRKLRDKKRAPLSQTALDGIDAEARKAGWPLEAALAECVTRGWQAFKADWIKPDDRLRNGVAATDGVDPLVASILAKKARENAGAPP